MDVSRRAILAAGAGLGLGLAAYGNGIRRDHDPDSGEVQGAMTMKETTTHYATVSEHVRQLRRREVSSLELVEAAISRIEAHDGKLNAVVVRDFERARTAARVADQALGARRAEAPAWCPNYGEGSLPCARPTHNLGHSGYREDAGGR
jgi:hypothetical protein